MKFRKKPVIIDAVQWNGTYEGMNMVFLEFPDIITRCLNCSRKNNTVQLWEIGTLEGGHIVSPGDWIIKGIAGEYYPCKPDIFEKTYEQVDA